MIRFPYYFFKVPYSMVRPLFCSELLYRYGSYRWVIQNGNDHAYDLPSSERERPTLGSLSLLACVSVSVCSFV